jgi:predicted acylesterase/phospholipase RssA/CRP-like cAMP-binding protein
MWGDAQRRFTMLESLSADDVDVVRGQMRPRKFAAGEVICREGDPGDSLFVIERGLAHVVLGPADTNSPTEATVERLRRGDVFGEMALLSGEPRSATVIAALPTIALELDREGFATVAARYPAVVTNLSRILSQRLRRATMARARSFQRGEVVSLLVDRRGADLVAPILTTAASASPRGVVAIDLTGTLPAGPLAIRLDDPSVPAALAALDELLPGYGTVLMVADISLDDVSGLVAQTDRNVAVLGLDGATRLANLPVEPVGGHEIVLLTEDPAEERVIGSGRVVRRCLPGTMSDDIAWVGRHLTRTKLGLALGAGGAKGYAHVATVQVLEEAGYTVDFVAGSSIGAMVGAWLALGQDGAAIEATMRAAFTPETVAAMFKLSLSGLSSGLDAMTTVCRETTAGGSFADLRIPLAAMTIDLDAREPWPLLSGPLWEALLAATALPGMFPPYQGNGRRLVDGLCLVPVPTEAVQALGADVVVSVNLMSRLTMPSWPGATQPEPAPARSNVRMLDTLLETLDLAQLDASVRHAALADVVVTPRFGPSTWREFDRADLFLAAGRAAAEEQLVTLRTLAKPQPLLASP